MEIGSATHLEEKLTMDIRGRDILSGLPKTMTISSDEITDALADTINAIVEAVKITLEKVRLSCPLTLWIAALCLLAAVLCLKISINY